MKQALLAVGGLLLLAGVVLGFVPQHADGVSCGSVFRASDDAFVADLTTSFGNEAGTAQDDCSDRRGMYAPIVWTLIVIGGVALIGGAVVTNRSVPAPVEVRRESV